MCDNGRGVVDPDPNHFGNPDPHQIKIRIRIRIIQKSGSVFASRSASKAGSGSTSICRWQAKMYWIWAYWLFEHFFKCMSLYLQARIRIRIRVKIGAGSGSNKTSIRIRISVMCGSATLYDGLYGQPTLFSVSSTNFWQSLEGLPMSGKMAAMAWNTVSAGMKAMSFFRCSTILSFSSFSSSSCRCWQICQFHHEM